MHFNPRKLIILAVVEFFVALPLFYLIFPTPPGFALGYNSNKINYAAPQLLAFYGMMVVLVIQIFLGWREIKAVKISSLLKQTSILATVLFAVVVFFALNTSVSKIMAGKSIFYDDSKDCRYYLRTHPFYKLTPEQRKPKDC